MDLGVIWEVIRPNLESTGFLDMSVIHGVRIETFYRNAERFVGEYVPSLISLMLLSWEVTLLQLLDLYWRKVL